MATASAQQATLAADQAAVDTARLNLQYTSISAPIAGRAGALTVHQGDLVRQNDTTPLLVINQMAPIYVGFSVPGRYLSDIRKYQAQRSLKVQARLQGSPTGPTQIAVGTPNARPGDAPPPAALPTAAAGPAPEEGVVSFIDNTVDPTTGTIKLKATFPNTSHSLWPGLFVQVTLLLTTDRDALVVPATAVQESQQGTYVYVIKPDRTAEMRNVQVDRQQGEETVIAQGVTAGEEVVTDGHLRLTPGARVTTGADSGNRGRGGTGGSRGRQGGAGRRGNTGRGRGWTSERGDIMNVAEPFIKRPGRYDAARHDHPDLRHHGLPAAAGQRPADGRLPDHPGQRQPARAPVPKRWPRRSRRRSRSSSRPSPGITSISSRSSQGSTNITLQFDLSRDIDSAAQDVQSTIARAQREPAAGHAVAAVVPEDRTRPTRRCSS